MRERGDMSSTGKLPISRTYSDVVPPIKDSSEVRARRNQVLAALRGCAVPVSDVELASALPRLITVEMVASDLRALAHVKLALCRSDSLKWEART
jgi:hypothetical protein